ncbi:MAG TPA: hypothetical protein VNM91_11470 [Dehalococcoidia bacterium]|nr:hypothetical protein [Dehalococcoidia bacterium]
MTTDFATTGCLADAFVLEGHHGHGVGVWPAERVMPHPRLHGLRVWRPGTRDAHGAYQKSGWEPLADREISTRRCIQASRDRTCTQSAGER